MSVWMQPSNEGRESENIFRKETQRNARRESPVPVPAYVMRAQGADKEEGGGEDEVGRSGEGGGGKVRRVSRAIRQRCLLAHVPPKERGKGKAGQKRIFEGASKDPLTKRNVLRRKGYEAKRGRG